MNTEEAIAKRGLKSIGIALSHWILVFKLDMFQICISSQGEGGGVTGDGTEGCGCLLMHLSRSECFSN